MGTFGNIKKNKSDITRICVWDFDGTLINTPVPEKGYVQYKEKTGQDWPHKGWWGFKAQMFNPQLNLNRSTNDQ